MQDKVGQDYAELKSKFNQLSIIKHLLRNELKKAVDAQGSYMFN